MLKKTYVANCVQYGKLVGHITVEIWFFQSPMAATDIMHRTVKLQGETLNLVDVRRLR